MSPILEDLNTSVYYVKNAMKFCHLKNQEVAMFPLVKKAAKMSKKFHNCSQDFSSD